MGRKATPEPVSRTPTAILQAVLFAITRFHSGKSWDVSVQDLIQALGKATGVSRVYIFSTDVDSAGVLRSSQQYEWCAPGITPEIDNPELQNFDLVGSGYARWVNMFNANRCISGQVSDFPVDERAKLEAQGIVSILVAPIKFDGKLWGYIGFDDCTSGRGWSEEEIDGLKIVAEIIGASTGYFQLLDRLMLTERVFHGMLERSEEGIIIVDEAGKIIFWNPAEERITGIPEKEALGMFSWDAQVQTAPEKYRTQRMADMIRDRTLRFLNPNLPKFANETLMMDVVSRANGITRKVETTIFPIDMPDRRLLGGICRDVTAQHQAAAELASSEERYRTIVQTQSELLCRISADGKLTFVNDAFSRYYSRPKEDMLGASIFDLMVVEERQGILDTLSDFLANPREFNFENTSRLMDGQLRYQRWMITPITNSSGEVVEIQAVGRDITMQREVVELLRLQRDLAVSLSASSDLATSLKFLLETATRIDGLDVGLVYLVDENNGKLTVVEKIGLEGFFEETSPARQGMEQTLSTLEQPFYLSSAMLTRYQNGPLMRGLTAVAGLPIRHEGKLIGVLALASHTEKDIPPTTRDAIETIAAQMGSALARIKSQTELQRSKQNFTELFDSLNDFLFVLDSKAHIVYANPVVTRRLGYESAALSGMTLADLYAENHRQAVNAAFGQVVTGKYRPIEQPILSISGEAFGVEMVFSPGYWDGQQVWFGIGRDISARQAAAAAEQEHRRLAEALANIAAAVNATLNFDEVLDLILENISQVVPNDTANIMLVDGDTARIVRCRGYQEHDSEEILLSKVFRLDDMPVLRRLKTSRQLIVVENTDVTGEWVLTPEGGWIKSYIGAPIVIRDEVVGIINVDSYQPGFYTPEHAARLKLFTDQVGTAIQNARLYEETRRRARQLALLNEITHLGLASNSFVDMMNMLADQLAAMFETSNVYMMLWKDESDAPTLTAASRSVQPMLASLAMHFEDEELGLLQASISTGKPIYIDDVTSAGFFGQRLASYTPDQSALTMPLIADGRRLGMVVVGFEHPRILTVQDLSMAEHASGQIALIVARSLSMDTERKRSAQLERANSVITALGKVATRVQHAPDLESVLETLGTELERLGFHSLVALRDGNEPHMRMRYFSQLGHIKDMLRKVGVLEIRSFPIDSDRFPVLRQLAEREEATYLDSPIQLVRGNMPEPLASLAGDLFRHVGLTNQSRSISLPLQVEDRTIGLLGLWSDTLESTDVPAAATFATQIAIAIEKTRLLDDVRELAITDDLTKVYNRRALYEFGQREVDIAIRFNRPLVALMVDGDWFKSVNDQYGHLVGDQVLTALAARLKGAVRDVDIVGRYGGDEFVIMLIEADMDSAITIARRLLTTVNDTSFDTDAGPTKLTISIGMAACNPETPTINDLIRLADRALYIAKEAGRNRLATIKGVMES
jgi:diguanylate cyclase (GGDEF)-like protein/PAS domain S-box-containing protein